MFLILAFVSGLGIGTFIDISIQDFNNNRADRYAELLQMDDQEDYYFHTDPTGQVWAIQQNRCVRVF